MTPLDSQHPLDNPLWNALTSEMALFAQGTALAKRFGDNAVAIADHSEAAYAELLPLVAPGMMPLMMEADPPSALPGLIIHHRQALLEMVCAAPPPLPSVDASVIPLTLADAPEIAVLVELTKPGPFFPELMAMGPFIGIRVEGQLVAVTGQRIHLTGFREVSTVCTHPDFQGRGYAALLVSHAARDIFALGEMPFLHVFPGNDRAQRLYERLGFRVRRAMEIIVVGR